MKSSHIIKAIALILFACGTIAGDGDIFSDGFEGDHVCDPDINEPDTESAAFFIGNLTDCPKSLAMIQGVLGTADDTDWFTYHGSDEFGCPVDPGISITSSASLSMCIYFECDSGAGSFTCPQGSAINVSPDGKTGCCTSNSDLSIDDLDCPGTDDSATVWARFHESTQDCNEYSATLNF